MDRRNLPFLILALLVLTAGVLLLTPGYSSQARAEGPGGIIPPDLLAALQKSSEVNVIIFLKSAALPPPGQLEPGVLDEYKRQLAEVQDRILTKLTPADFTLTARLSLIAALGGRITESGVEKLRGHPDVIRVFLDFAGILHPKQPVDALPGDANCDGTANGSDALLVLQFDAALIQSLPCEGSADVSGDGEIDARDAAVILQIEAGLCCA